MTYNGKVYRKQGATEMTIDAGGYLNAASGKVTLPGTLMQGCINLPLGDAMEVSSADSLNALTSGTVPLIGRINAGTDPKGRISWTSNADPIQWDVMPPPDMSTVDGLTLGLYGEISSGAVNGWVADVRFGVGDANAGATAGPITSSPSLMTIAVASGNVIANTPFAVILSLASATGTVSLYGARVVYTKKTS